MRTAEELDRMHEEIVARYPGGINFEQYKRVVLESADEDGKVYPHSLGNWFTQQSALMKMMFDGLIVHRGRHDDPSTGTSQTRAVARCRMEIVHECSL